MVGGPVAGCTRGVLQGRRLLILFNRSQSIMSALAAKSELPSHFPSHFFQKKSKDCGEECGLEHGLSRERKREGKVAQNGSNHYDVQRTQRNILSHRASRSSRPDFPSSPN